MDGQTRKIAARAALRHESCQVLRVGSPLFEKSAGVSENGDVVSYRAIKRSVVHL